MGPKQAAQIFKERHADAFRFKVTLYGSLAATGKGHLTDVAIREELGDPSKGSFGAERCNADYGQNEAPLIFRNGDPVADMLYTCNFAVFALNEAACATGDPKIRKMADSLGEFLVRIQVRSNSRKNVDGAWFRAFNYRNWDYWASNADAGWGAQSTLTGWIQSWIVATLALMEKGTSFWDVTLP